ncbi:MAG: DUF3526 domain-containing protein [Methylotenera sp.]|nr:DUF3526 domain-containing protein [Methylotenera sp.]
MLKFECLLIFRQKLMVAALLFCMLICAIALWNGWLKTQTIHEEIRRAISTESHRHQQQITKFGRGAEAGETAYYVYHTVYNTPGQWSFISLGNRSYSPHVQRVRLLGLQSQLYDGESHNPEYAVAGHFDFAFVVIFMLPLICVALAHDLCPIERSQNRLTLLKSLTTSLNALWIRRLLLRWLIASASILLPLTACVVMLQLPLTDFVKISLAVLAYGLFWTFLSGLLSLRRSQPSTSANATLCLVLWLLIVIVIPSTANVLINKTSPFISGAEIALEHRKKVHDAWDLSKEQTFDTFFKAHPEWKDTSKVTTRFHWKWYYAFQQVADMAVDNALQQRHAALLQRDQRSRLLGILIPSVALQYWMDDISDNNLQNLLAFRAKVSNYHTELRHYFYPYLFNEHPFHQKDFKAMPRFKQ